jgi:hypothetical protein
MVFKFRNGTKVKDKITGFTGIITARTDYLHGCARYFVEPEVDENGNHREGHSFDEGSLKLVEEKRVEPTEVQTEKRGGPRQGPTSPKCFRRM